MLQIHGIFMVLAWMSSAASGMFLARYYKQTWRSSTIMDKDIWFRLHQFFMGCAVLSTLTGIIVIFIDRGFSPLSLDSVKINPHPALGFTAFILAMIQPIMAAFR